MAQIVLGIGKDAKLFGIEWFVYAILIWLFLLAYHFVSVFITNKFMGTDWEKHTSLKGTLPNKKEHIEKLRTKID